MGIEEQARAIDLPKLVGGRYSVKREDYHVVFWQDKTHPGEVIDMATAKGNYEHLSGLKIGNLFLYEPYANIDYGKGHGLRPKGTILDGEYMLVVQNRKPKELTLARVIEPKKEEDSNAVKQINLYDPRGSRILYPDLRRLERSGQVNRAIPIIAAEFR